MEGGGSEDSSPSLMDSEFVSVLRAATCSGKLDLRKRGLKSIPEQGVYVYVYVCVYMNDSA